MIGGTPTVGDVVALNASWENPQTSAQTASPSYMVLSTDTPTTIAAALAAAITSNGTLAASSISATSIGASIYPSHPPGLFVFWTRTITGAATETVALGANSANYYGYIQRLRIFSRGMQNADFTAAMPGITPSRVQPTFWTWNTNGHIMLNGGSSYATAAEARYRVPAAVVRRGVRRQHAGQSADRGVDPAAGCIPLDQGPGTDAKLCAYSGVGWAAAFGLSPLTPASMTGYIVGPTPATGGNNTSVLLAAGASVDSTTTVLMADAAACAVDLSTAGVNGLDTGSIAASTWYVFFQISGTAGTACIGTATTPAGVPTPTLPSGYSYYRYVARAKTNPVLANRCQLHSALGAILRRRLGHLHEGRWQHLAARGDLFRMRRRQLRRVWGPANLGQRHIGGRWRLRRWLRAADYLLRQSAASDTLCHDRRRWHRADCADRQQLPRHGRQ